MHPLEALNEAELNHLTKVTQRLINSRHLLAPGNRPDRLRPGFGIEFLDNREFTPGDDIRDIDWRSTARSRHTQIRRYCDEASSDWFIVLDASASMAFDSGNKWALAIQCAAAFAYLLNHQGNRVSIIIFSDHIEQVVPLGRGYGHYASILQTLRKKTPPSAGGGSDLRCCISRIKHRSPVLVISDFLTPDHMQDGLKALSFKGDRLHALQILSSREYQLPTQDRIRIKDVESGRTLAINLDNTAREDYQKAMKDFCDTLANYCEKSAICFSSHRADAPWKSVLVSHLQSRSRQK